MRAKNSRGRGSRRRTEPPVSKEDLVRYIRKSADRGMNLQRILEDFDATPGARKQIKDILNQLVKEGKLAKHRGNRYEAPARNLIEGTILVHRDGYGFVMPKEKVQGIESDIYIPPALIGSAMSGDKVRVEITFRKPGGRAEGRIASVEKRARDTVVGQLRYDGEGLFVAPADSKLPEKIIVTNDVAEHKDKIVEVEITRFPGEARWPAGKVVSVIGFLDDPNVETNVIIKKFGLPTSFPEKVSNHLCSLNPKTDRLALSVMMHLSKTGEAKDYSFHKSVIHSKQRMTYEEVQGVLDGNRVLENKFEDVLPQIQTIARVAEMIRKRRQQRGAIDFDLPEPMLTYDAKGELEGIVKSVRLFSHRIVEEFMILANEVVARHLEENDIPSLYRVHEEPDPMKVQEFAEIVSGFGLKFEPRKAEPAEFQKFISSIEGRPEERMLSYLMLRSFKQAKYSDENIGHFGLASDSYTHFTSPIRRYPDLIVHRVLKGAISRKPEPAVPQAQLEAIATESSERERLADQAERELFDWKKMLLIEQHLGDTFEAIIIAVWRDGLSIELIDYFIEGYIAVAEIPGDYYQLDQRQHALIGRRTGQHFRLGDRINVQVARVDKLLRRAYFVPAFVA